MDTDTERSRAKKKMDPRPLTPAEEQLAQILAVLARRRAQRLAREGQSSEPATKPEEPTED